MGTCKCNVGLGNTGTPTCQPIANVAKKLIIIPTYDDAGVRNSIDLTATLDQAYFTAAVNNTDSSQRWFPLVNMENITNERADSIFETAASGRNALIREGFKAFAGEMWNQSPAFLGKVKEARCTDISAFVIDNDGNIIGSETVAGFLYPIRINKASWDAKLVETTDTTVQKVSLGFEWHEDAKDEDIRMITSDEYTGDVVDMRGLLDITAVYTNITTTGFTATLSTIYGSPISLIKDKGLIITDFALAELTPTPGAIVITSVTESADGVYDFVIPSQTSADVLELTPSKDGRDYTAVVANTILIP